MEPNKKQGYMERDYDHPSVLDVPQETPTKATRLINKVVVLALIIIAVSLGILLHWSLQSDKVFDIKNQPFPSKIVDDTKSSSRIIILNVDVCKLQDIQGDLRISYVSESREVFLPASKERSPKGCTKTDIPILVPVDLPSDTYKIRFVAIYDLNPLKKGVKQTFESQSIKIDNNTPSTTPIK